MIAAPPWALIAQCCHRGCFLFDVYSSLRGAARSPARNAHSSSDPLKIYDSMEDLGQYYVLFHVMEDLLALGEKENL